MIVDIIFIVAVVGLLIAIYKIKFSKENIQKQIDEATKKSQEQHFFKNKNESNNVQVEQNIKATANQEEGQWQNDSESSDEDVNNPINLRKQLRKQQKQKEKQQRKESQEQYLQTQKQKREKYDKQSQQKDKLQEQKRKKQEQIIEQLRQQERKRKQEEFNKWKDMMSVEQTGKQKLSADQEKQKIETFNKKFIGVLQKNKLSLLEDLSHKFKLSTKELVDKIKEFEQKQLISGIFDERGKYLVIQKQEWLTIKNYINAKGRVKKTDIMKQCARIIKIPQNNEQDLLNLIKVQDEK